MGLYPLYEETFSNALMNHGSSTPEIGYITVERDTWFTR